MQKVFPSGSIDSYGTWEISTENVKTGEMRVSRENSKWLGPTWKFDLDRMSATEDVTDRVQNALTLGPESPEMVFHWKYVDSSTSP